jgi:PhnB protein
MSDPDPETNPRKAEPAPVHEGLMAYLTVDGPLKAATFYAPAFGAQQVAALPAGPQEQIMSELNGGWILRSEGDA